MKGNGFKVFLTVFFIGLCGYYLYPSVENLMISQRMSDMTEQERIQYEQENYSKLQQVRSESLKLGLDLLGGMHTTLEVQVPELVGELAQERDDRFNEVLRAATERTADGGDFIAAFVDEFEARDEGAQLSRYFRSESAGIDRRSTNAEVASYLQDEADEAVQRAMEIIRNRVDRFGVAEPSIQRQGERRIIVELPGVDEPERVRNLLQGTARLEFRLMADPEQLAESARRIIEYYEELDPAEVPDIEDLGDPEDVGETPAGFGGDQPPEGADAPLPEDAVDGQQDQPTPNGPDAHPQDQPQQQQEPAAPPQDEPALPQEEAVDPQQDPMADIEADERDNPLLAVFQPLPEGQTVVFGHAVASDTARVNQLLNKDEVRAMLPTGVELMYGANPVGQTAQGEPVFRLLGVRTEVELAGESITDASVEFDQYTNEPRVAMTMDSEGARIWGRVTGANVGNPVAIALDGVIYSFPNVEERILGGRSSISGLQSRREAQDIVNVLRSGALPAPVEIVEERTVGPSLGEASIRAGFISVVSGLIIVALFMMGYYRTGGVIANTALLLNIIFILGILAGFGATLTLPGIAGIVLTIGMAVDANVLIFDRIREEMNTGKTLRAAIDTGYKKAMSAILDANITTFFVGAILYSFGVGPIQGFAVTLMAGILSSLFTAIIVTRILTDYMVVDKKRSLSYG